MGTFKYRAKEGSGNTVEGVIEAQTTEEAVEKINQLGYMPVRVEETLAPAKKQEPAGRPQTISPATVARKPFFGHGIKSREITAFGRQLSSLVRSGVPILSGIGIVAEQSENVAFKNLLSRIHEEVKNGASFSSALGKYPRVFPPLYVALTQAGEASGTLDQALSKITDYRQKQEEILSRIRSAMIYPALMAITGVGTIVFMLTFVLPRLLSIFSDLGGNLPLPTRILIQTSNTMREPWFWALLVAALLFGSFMMRGGKGKSQNLFLSELKLRIPIFGSFTLKAELARFTRTLELLVKSGVPIIRAIETTIPVLGSVVLKNEVGRSLQEIREGGSFAKSLRKSRRLPLFMTNLLVVGEESGKLDEALGETALFYERETDEAIRTVVSLLEPLLILAMGLVIGFIVVAMLLPMFELNMMVR